ncbi:bcl2-associated agonist of cell death isoform X2 [Sardina pilchardus]|uniref:bcl2-associated agonist of cell death isoform X2 n=1 Tax=Sardina pilchardus TaxID=27697 RepID=UPI002E11398A
MENHTGSSPDPSTDPADLDERTLPADTHTEEETDLNFPQDRQPNTIKSGGGRVRLYSESQVYTISRCEEAEPAEGGGASEEGTGDGAPFRGRSQSAPAALWAAKRYGRQLRRMSDEFDTWLDRGAMKRRVEGNK